MDTERYSRRVGVGVCMPALLLTMFVIAVLLPKPAHAWKNANGCATTEDRWDEDFTHVKVVFADTTPAKSVPFTSTEKAIVEAAFRQFNSLPNASIFFYEAGASESCVGELSQDTGQNQPPGTVCVMKKANRTGGQGLLGGPCGAGTFGEVELGADLASDKDFLWKLASQEIAHVLGVGHADQGTDWMNGTLSAGSGGTGEHVGMTRDTMNALNFKYPFTQSFAFGDFEADGEVDVLIRDSFAGNQVGWYLVSRVNGAWVDRGLAISDLAQGNTITNLSGDFSGDGCEDMAAGHCDGCNPADGVGDDILWRVRTGDCNGGFSGVSTWKNDFGNGEDYNNYQAGDFDGNGCEDLWLIRDKGSPSCDGNSTGASGCKVEIWVSKASGSGSECDEFGSAQMEYELPASDRSAAWAWPWVVGDFVADANGCADLAYGVGSQSDPRVLSWYVLESYDSNSNNICDSLRPANSGATWNSNFGDLGEHYFIAADAGGGSEDDLILVRPTVKPGEQRASWYVAENTGSSFVNQGVRLLDLWVTGAEEHWTGMVFAAGNFGGTFNTDFITLMGTKSWAPVQYGIGFRSTSASVWSASSTEGGYLGISGSPSSSVNYAPNTADQPVNAGYVARDTWWCRNCAQWR